MDVSSGGRDVFASVIQARRLGKAPTIPVKETLTMLPIVPVQEAYAASYRDCLDVVARERKYLAQVEALPLERITAFVRDSVANDAVQFFALDGDRVVGWADVFPHWASALAHCGTLGMGVHPDYRGQGLGRRLLAACIEKCQTKGITRIGLEARADNTRALRLYEQMGFQREAVKARAMRFDGVYFDAVQMALLLDEPPGAERRVTRQRISSGSPFESQMAYSRAVVQGDWAFVSGTTGFDYATMSISDRVDEQARQCFENISAALRQAGASLADVVRVHYIVPHGPDFEVCWPVMREYLGPVQPAATMISAQLLDPRMRIEIEVTALKTS
jgi:enamine deaminase RidA (YjgF/YER057c/UK114 family)/ribosomal protein S18 acetylase RimI-like enzyme